MGKERDSKSDEMPLNGKSDKESMSFSSSYQDGKGGTMETMSSISRSKATDFSSNEKTESSPDIERPDRGRPNEVAQTNFPQATTTASGVDIDANKEKRATKNWDGNPKDCKESGGNHDVTKSQARANNFYDFLTGDDSKSDMRAEDAQDIAVELGIASPAVNNNHQQPSSSFVANAQRVSIQGIETSIEMMPPPPPAMTTLARQHVVVPPTNPGAYAEDLEGTVPTEPVRLSGVARANLSAAADAAAAAEMTDTGGQEPQAPQRGSSRLLVTANPISSMISLPTAEELPEVSESDSEIRRKKNTRIVLLGLSAMLVVIIVVVAILVTFLASPDLEKKSDNQQQQYSTGMATPVPTTQYEFVVSLLPEYTTEALRDTFSPQYKAFQWTLQDPYLSEYPHWRIMQRFSLVTLFYATDGARWGNSTNWLEYHIDECLWFGSIVPLPLAKHELASNLVEENWNDPICVDNKYQLLRLSTNRLKGTIPQEMFWLTALKSVQLFANDISGTIPTSFHQLTELQTLGLVANKLTGGIPTEIGLLSSLRGLGFYYNPIGGTLPSEVGLMANLEEIFLEECELEGSIPSELGLLTKLHTMDLGSNGFSGHMAAALGLVHGNIDLSPLENKLGGPIPTEIGLLSRLAHIDASGNELTGPIPSQVGLLHDVVSIRLFDNLFTGALPSEVGEMESLLYLDLSWNDLAGALPDELFQITSLIHLYVEENVLSGVLGSDIGKLTSLEWFYLQGNKLRGKLPRQLSNIPGLYELRLQGNSFSGPIPSEFGMLQYNLTYLDASNNGLTGQLPSELGLLTVLEHFDVSYNELSGTISAELGGLPAMAKLNISGNELLSGTLPGKLCDLFLLRFDCASTFCGCDCDCEL